MEDGASRSLARRGQRGQLRLQQKATKSLASRHTEHGGGARAELLAATCAAQRGADGAAAAARTAVGDGARRAAPPRRRPGPSAACRRGATAATVARPSARSSGRAARGGGLHQRGRPGRGAPRRPPERRAPRGHPPRPVRRRRRGRRGARAQRRLRRGELQGLVVRLRQARPSTIRSTPSPARPRRPAAAHPGSEADALRGRSPRRRQAVFKSYAHHAAEVRAGGVILGRTGKGAFIIDENTA